jgi:hypothetical protein
VGSSRWVSPVQIRDQRPRRSSLAGTGAGSPPGQGELLFPECRGKSCDLSAPPAARSASGFGRLPCRGGRGPAPVPHHLWRVCSRLGRGGPGTLRALPRHLRLHRALRRSPPEWELCPAAGARPRVDQERHMAATSAAASVDRGRDSTPVVVRAGPSPAAGRVLPGRIVSSGLRAACSTSAWSLSWYESSQAVDRPLSTIFFIHAPATADRCFAGSAGHTFGPRRRRRPALPAGPGGPWDYRRTPATTLPQPSERASGPLRMQGPRKLLALRVHSRCAAPRTHGIRRGGQGCAAARGGARRPRRPDRCGTGRARAPRRVVGWSGRCGVGPGRGVSRFGWSRFPGPLPEPDVHSLHPALHKCVPVRRR